MICDLGEQPFWTEADATELDLLTWEVVRAAFAHRERCSTCRVDRWCPVLSEAVGHLLDWREGRILRSKAAWLRARQQAREDLGVAA